MTCASHGLFGSVSDARRKGSDWRGEVEGRRERKGMEEKERDMGKEKGKGLSGEY